MAARVEIFHKFEDNASREENPHTLFPLDGQDISKVSDETLTALFDTAPVIHSYEGTRIVRISQTLIMKGGGMGTRPSEAHILNLIHKHNLASHDQTQIVVPRVHRILNVQTENVWFGCKCMIVMDYIPGPTVEQCWDTLSEIERADVVAQVAAMITTLHSIPIPASLHPGPVGCSTCLARGFWFRDIGSGPFATRADIETYFTNRLTICKAFEQAPEKIPPFKFSKLVLTHQDIAPRNLILDSGGKVWMIDWGDAGVYPEGLEVAALGQRRFSAPEFTDMLLELIPKHEELAERLGWIGYALTTGQYLDVFEDEPRIRFFQDTT